MELTEQTLTAVTLSQDFKHIKQLSLQDLSLAQCFPILLYHFGTTLQILSLSRNKLLQIDISLGFSRLRKLDLSSNQLQYIGPPQLWNSMPSLQILYLHANQLQSEYTLQVLQGLPRILHLTLFNNPVVHLPNYRPYLLRYIPSLLALDFSICPPEEKAGYTLKQNYKFRVSIQDSTDLQVFRQHLYQLKRKWEKCSPSIKIQSLWRRYKVRNNMGEIMSDKDYHAIKIQKVVRSWLQKKRLERDLLELLRQTDNEHLLYAPEDYLNFSAVRVIENFYKDRYVPRKIRSLTRNTAAVKIQKIYRGWTALNKNLPFLPSQKIYVLKSQQRVLICMLRALSKKSNQFHPANSVTDRIAPEFFKNLDCPKTEFQFSELYQRIQECLDTKVLRFPDLESLPYSYVPYFQFTSWIFKSKMAPNCPKSIENLRISSKYKQIPQIKKLQFIKPRIQKFTSQQIQKFRDLNLKLDDYLDLIQFEPPSQAFLFQLFLLSLQYNHFIKNKQLGGFVILFSPLVKRLKAVCTIQSFWRSYKDTSNVNMVKKILYLRAAIAIQRWWRGLRFYRRMSYMQMLRTYIQKLKFPIVYLQQHFFQHMQITPLTYLSIPQQYTDFYCKQDGLYISIPKRLGGLLGLHFKQTNDYQEITEQQRTLQAVVLTGAQIQVVSLFSEVFNKSKVADSNLKFIKLEYSSVQELKRRAALIFLKTFDHQSSSFIQFFTYSDLEDPFLMSKLRKVWNPRQINYQQPTQAVSLLKQALEPIDDDIMLMPRDTPTNRDLNYTVPLQDYQDIQYYREPTVLKTPALKIRRKSPDSQLLKTRVREVREDKARRRAQSMIARQMVRQSRLDQQKGWKQSISQQRKEKNSQDLKEKVLKRALVLKEKEKRKFIDQERSFVNKFAQARNMLQKLTIKSDIHRYKLKSQNDVKKKVKQFKKSCRERRSLVQQILYEKFKSRFNN